MARIISKISILLALILALQFGLFAQEPPRSQEISETDGLPVIVKHLPEWENVQGNSLFINNAADLQKAVPGREVLKQIDFAGGTEAVTASYPAGKLLIVEFTSPQGSVDADGKILQQLAAKPESGTVYRRVGNYNVFVFDAADEVAAAGLIDQVSYEKTVQWLGEDPYLLKKLERYFVSTTRDIFISTVLWIVGGLGLSIVCGIIVGFIFYRVREDKRANWTRFSDAGGLTRLNLDELSE